MDDAISQLEIRGVYTTQNNPSTKNINLYSLPNIASLHNMDITHAEILLAVIASRALNPPAPQIPARA